MSEDPMWCAHHEDAVSWSQFEYKGCWGCEHFSGLDDEEDLYTDEAAALLGVTIPTVRRWIREHLLEGTLYKRGRRQFSMSSPPMKYVVDRKSVEKLCMRRKREPKKVPHD